MKKATKDKIVMSEILQAEEYCIENGIDFVWINERQVRYTKDFLRIDLFPLGKKYHNITTQERGYYKDIVGFIMINFI